MLTWICTTDALEPVAESGATSLLRSFHDRTGGVGIVGSAMPPPHRAVIVL